MDIYTISTFMLKPIAILIHLMPLLATLDVLRSTLVYTRMMQMLIKPVPVLTVLIAVVCELMNVSFQQPVRVVITHSVIYVRIGNVCSAIHMMHVMQIFVLQMVMVMLLRTLVTVLVFRVMVEMVSIHSAHHVTPHAGLVIREA
jgi:hypothetical protein